MECFVFLAVTERKIESLKNDLIQHKKDKQGAVQIKMYCHVTKNSFKKSNTFFLVPEIRHLTIDFSLIVFD